MDERAQLVQDGGGGLGRCSCWCEIDGRSHRLLVLKYQGETARFR
jgi:hypothetical protein